MKKVLVSLTLALALVMAMIVPVSAATQTGATVTVSSYINFTVTDNGATAGHNFGSLNPGTTDTAESEQGGSGAVTLTVAAETNENTNIQTKGDNFSITRTNGTATGGTGTTLVDTGVDFGALGVIVGDIIINRTDGSTGTVTTVAATTLTASGGFSGGADNTPASGDLYSVRAASPASTIPITNAKWDTDSAVAGATAMSTSYATITTSTAGAEKVQDAWHWLSVPNGQAPGTYTGIFYYQAVAQ